MKLPNTSYVGRIKLKRHDTSSYIGLFIGEYDAKYMKIIDKNVIKSDGLSLSSSTSDAGTDASPSVNIADTSSDITTQTLPSASVIVDDRSFEIVDDNLIIKPLSSSSEDSNSNSNSNVDSIDSSASISNGIKYEKNAIGIVKYQDTSFHAGGFSFPYGIKQGIGVMQEVNGDIIQATFDKNVKHGVCVCTFSDSGDRFIGECKFGERTGMGQYTWAFDGSSHEGEYLNGLASGYGVLFQSLKGETYMGEFTNDRQHGYGVCFFPNGDMYEGQWRNGERSGYGRYSKFDGSYTQEGEWKSGFLVVSTNDNEDIVDLVEKSVEYATAMMENASNLIKSVSFRKIISQADSIRAECSSICAFVRGLQLKINEKLQLNESENELFQIKPLPKKVMDPTSVKNNADKLISKKSLLKGESNPIPLIPSPTKPSISTLPVTNNTKTTTVFQSPMLDASTSSKNGDKSLEGETSKSNQKNLTPPARQPPPPPTPASIPVLSPNFVQAIQSPFFEEVKASPQFVEEFKGFISENEMIDKLSLTAEQQEILNRTLQVQMEQSRKNKFKIDTQEIDENKFSSNHFEFEQSTVSSSIIYSSFEQDYADQNDFPTIPLMTNIALSSSPKIPLHFESQIIESNKVQSAIEPIRGEAMYSTSSNRISLYNSSLIEHRVENMSQHVMYSSPRLVGEDKDEYQLIEHGSNVTDNSELPPLPPPPNLSEFASLSISSSDKHIELPVKKINQEEIEEEKVETKSHDVSNIEDIDAGKFPTPELSLSLSDTQDINENDSGKPKKASNYVELTEAQFNNGSDADDNDEVYTLSRQYEQVRTGGKNKRFIPLTLKEANFTDTSNNYTDILQDEINITRQLHFRDHQSDAENQEHGPTNSSIYSEFDDNQNITTSTPQFIPLYKVDISTTVESKKDINENNDSKTNSTTSFLQTPARYKDLSFDDDFHPSVLHFSDQKDNHKDNRHSAPDMIDLKMQEFIMPAVTASDQGLFISPMNEAVKFVTLVESTFSPSLEFASAPTTMHVDALPNASENDDEDSTTFINLNLYHEKLKEINNGKQEVVEFASEIPYRNLVMVDSSKSIAGQTRITPAIGPNIFSTENSDDESPPPPPPPYPPGPPPPPYNSTKSRNSDKIQPPTPSTPPAPPPGYPPFASSTSTVIESENDNNYPQKPNRLPYPPENAPKVPKRPPYPPKSEPSVPKRPPYPPKDPIPNPPPTPPTPPSISKIPQSKTSFIPKR